MKIKVTISIKIGNTNYDYALADSLEITNNTNPKAYIKGSTMELIRLLLKNEKLNKELNAR